jgi:hypothetical protein
MMPPLTDEQCIAAVEAVARHHGSVKRAAAELGINYFTFKHHLKRAAARGFYKGAGVMPGFVISRVSTTQDAAGNVVRKSVQQRPEPEGGAFALPEGHRVKGVSALVDSEGRVVQQWFKTREDGVDPLAFAEALKQAMLDARGSAPAIPEPNEADADMLTVYVVADLHAGLLAWGREAGEDYDLKIAEGVLRRELARIVAMSPPSAHAVLLLAGDTMHQDDQTNMTPRSGHQLDVDGRFQKVLSTTARALVAASDLVATKHKGVEVVVLPGNHDPHAALALRVALSLRYEEHDRIAVPALAGLHWVREFGINLIAGTHGHTMKLEKMAAWLPAEYPEAWGRTRIRRVFSGHTHHQRRLEIGGVVVESFSPASARDAYAAGGGYHSERAINAVTFHAELGEICRHRVSIAG